MKSRLCSTLTRPQSIRIIHPLPPMRWYPSCHPMYPATKSLISSPPCISSADVCPRYRDTPFSVVLAPRRREMSEKRRWTRERTVVRAASRCGHVTLTLPACSISISYPAHYIVSDLDQPHTLRSRTQLRRGRTQTQIQTQTHHTTSNHTTSHHSPRIQQRQIQIPSYPTSRLERYSILNWHELEVDSLDQGPDFPIGQEGGWELVKGAGGLVKYKMCLVLYRLV
jgi:hypothetical protein